MNPIAVTGAGGFLGTHLGEVLENNGYTYIHLARDVRAFPDRMRSWLAQSKPAAIIHLAGVSEVGFGMEHPVEAFQSNVAETATMLESLRQYSPETPVIYVASDKSFGEQESCGLKTSYRPSFPYETSKACEDMLVECYAKAYAFPAFLLRFPNFFGEADRHLSRLIPGICAALARGEIFIVRTRLDGTSRQYIYVRDAAQIIVKTLESVLGGRSAWPKSHFAPPHVKTVGGVIADVEAVTGRKLNLEILNLPGEVSRLTLKDENCLDYAYTDWLVALERTAHWYLKACSSGIL